MSLSNTLSGLLILLTIVVPSCAQEWHWVNSPLCAQLKVKKLSVSNRSYTIYQAPDASECCKGLRIQSQGRTDRLGFFKAADLPDGHYFAVFDLKDQLVVPLNVQRRGVAVSGCGTESAVITVDKKTGKVMVQSFISVD